MRRLTNRWPGSTIVFKYLTCLVSVDLDKGFIGFQLINCWGIGRILIDGDPPRGLGIRRVEHLFQKPFMRVDEVVNWLDSLMLKRRLNFCNIVVLGMWICVTSREVLVAKDCDPCSLKFAGIVGTNGRFYTAPKGDEFSPKISWCLMI